MKTNTLSEKKCHCGIVGCYRCFYGKHDEHCKPSPSVSEQKECKSVCLCYCHLSEKGRRAVRIYGLNNDIVDCLHCSPSICSAHQKKDLNCHICYPSSPQPLQDCECCCHGDKDHSNMGEIITCICIHCEKYINKPLQNEEGWEKESVGMNVHSVYVFCYECKTDGINFPLERKCGNCGSEDTMTYYDRETISLIISKQIQLSLQEERQRIKTEIEKEKYITKGSKGEDWQIKHAFNQGLSTALSILLKK